MEKIVIPRTEETIAWIDSRIEEQDRENVIQLKTIKDRMERIKALNQVLTQTDDDDTITTGV
ncbi:MAG: V-type ATP synthase subunit D [Sphaerochaeta sp.]